jgi:DnaK suppressor protein
MLWLDVRHFEKRLEQWRGALEAQLRLALEQEPDPPPGSLEDILRQAAAAQMREIEAALIRIQQGIYGTCQRCGELLPAQRLQATPWARWCFPCQAAALGNQIDLVPYHAPERPGAANRS